MKIVIAAIVAAGLVTPALASHGSQSDKYGGFCLKTPKPWPWWATADVNFKGQCPKKH